MRAPSEQDVACLVRGRSPRAAAGMLVAVLATLGVAACGSSSSSSPGRSASRNPQTLLRQTFSKSHAVRSGVLGFSLVVRPRGSSIVTSPLSLSLGGPFQSRGTGRTPESAFTIAFAGLGRKGSFGVRTTATGAYVSLQGTNYRLPAADVAKLQSTLANGSAKSSSPGLSTFGIDPEDWVTDPRIVGTQTIDGVVTEHVHATVDVSAFIKSVNRVLARESASGRGLGGATRLVTPKITPSAARRIVAAVRDPTVDVYTGRSDTTLRRLVVSATVPASGEVSTRLGGLTSASFSLTFDYTHLNQPQTISAPSGVHSYAQLQTRLRSLGAQIESELGGGLGAAGSSGTGSSGTGSSGTGSSGAGSSGAVSKYSSCISKAAGDVRKMRHCATLLQSGG